MNVDEYDYFIRSKYLVTVLVIIILLWLLWLIPYLLLRWSMPIKMEDRTKHIFPFENISGNVYQHRVLHTIMSGSQSSKVMAMSYIDKKEPLH